jgi:hypothetical protein
VVLADNFLGWSRRSIRHFRWGLYDRDSLPRWTNGRLALLGDAAHAMLPHMGQGANQAIEDGMALATLMRGTDAADVTEVLLRYQARVWSDRRDRSIADRLDVHVTLVGRTPDLDLAFGAIRSSDGCERKTASVAHDVLH